MTDQALGRLGRFEIAEELGRGAMGVVYRGMHPGLGVPVAIKVLAETYSRDESFRARFQREAATVASLNHPGIVRIYDFDAHQGALFIVMEFVEGRTLRGWLNESGRFTLAVSQDLIQQLLSAVGAAHVRGIVHRDLKPDNVIISTQGKTKITDFGISKVLDDSASLTATGSMVGTPAYMSPEQVRGDPVDGRADIYALGIILYELLHGRPPFAGSMPAVLHSQVFDQPRPSTAIPRPVFDVIVKAMAKDPADRFQSCEEFSGALLGSGTRPEIPPPPQAAPPQPIQAPIADDVHKGACGHHDCDGKEGWQCSYTDATGMRCTSWWCKHHVAFVDGTPFCTRHAAVLKALAATAGTIREIKARPAVSDRSLNLANMTADDVDKDMTELLRRRYQGRKDVRLVVDHTIRQTWEGRGEVVWERSWSVVKAQGYMARVSIRVAAAAPDELKVLVGQTVVLSVVPDWISRRQEGEAPDRADRARFRQRVIDAVLSQIDAPSPAPAPHPNSARPVAPAHDAPVLNRALVEGMVLRLLTTSIRLTAFEIAEQMAVPFGAIESALSALAAANFIEALGFASGQGPWTARPLPERMAYAVTTQGRERAEEMGAAGTRYVGPAPVSMAEYRAAVAESGAQRTLTPDQVAVALDGLEVPPGVVESVRAAVNSRGSLFLYGAPGNGKTSLARRLVALQGGPVLVPVALDLEGEVVRIFDPAVHRMHGEQPRDHRWHLVERPLVQVGGEFALEMLEPTWEPGSRSYEAPLQVKANCGVFLIDDLGRQKVTPKQVLDRLLVPLEQGVDFMNFSSSGRKAEVPFKCQLTFSTNMSPAELLDEAYLRRLSYKVLMPDPTWESYQRIFERERARLNVAPGPPAALEMIRTLYGGQPMRGSHPRDLLERLVDVAATRGQVPGLTPALIEAAWQTLFVAS